MLRERKAPARHEVLPPPQLQRQDLLTTPGHRDGSGFWREAPDADSRSTQLSQAAAKLTWPTIVIFICSLICPTSTCTPAGYQAPCGWWRERSWAECTDVWNKHYGSLWSVPHKRTSLLCPLRWGAEAKKQREKLLFTEHLLYPGSMPNPWQAWSHCNQVKWDVLIPILKMR